MAQYRLARKYVDGVLGTAELLSADLNVDKKEIYRELAKRLVMAKSGNQNL